MSDNNENKEETITNKDFFRAIGDWFFGGKKEKSHGSKEAKEDESPKEVIETTAEAREEER